MREIRIVEILKELSLRLKGLNDSMIDLVDDFYGKKRPFMQIRKDAYKNIKIADIIICRLLAIASENGISTESNLFLGFDKKRAQFNKIELFFH